MRFHTKELNNKLVLAYVDGAKILNGFKVLTTYIGRENLGKPLTAAGII